MRNQGCNIFAEDTIFYLFGSNVEDPSGNLQGTLESIALVHDRLSINENIFFHSLAGVKLVLWDTSTVTLKRWHPVTLVPNIVFFLGCTSLKTYIIWFQMINGDIKLPLRNFEYPQVTAGELVSYLFHSMLILDNLGGKSSFKENPPAQVGCMTQRMS